MASYESRSSTERFLVGQIRDKIPDIQLPTNRDVLKFLYYKKHALKNKSPEQDICCKINSQNVADCLSETGCSGKESPCVVRAVKLVWDKSGIKTFEDRWIS